MFGKNPIRSIIYDPSKLAVEDVFYTIQGEGPYSGMPALFIRMSGCNLACHFCDTQFEVNAEKPEHWLDIVSKVGQFPYHQRKFIVLTGGEPLRQNVSWLVNHLLNSGTELIQIETAGTLWQPDLEEFIVAGKVVLVCSPKTPKVHPMIRLYCRHWKYIIIYDHGVGAWDGLPGIGTQEATRHSFQMLYRPPQEEPGHTIWVSPCDEYDAKKNKKNQDRARDLCLQHGYRLSLQIHKLIGVA